MANSRKLIVEVVGDSSKLDRSLKGVETRTQTFAKRLQGKTGIGGGLLFGGVGKGGAAAAGIAAGTGIAVVALKKVVDKAKEAQIEETNLKQAFDSAGVSAKKFGKQIDNTIQSISKLSGFDDEEVSASFANLLRTTGSIDKATRDSAVAANIARARRISLAAATKVVEKAETGQLRGLKALGVQIDKNTTATEAIDQAQRKFAGSAERYGKTAAGAQDQLNVALENIEERLGAKLLPLITKVSLKIVEFLDFSEKNWPKFAKAVSDAYDKVRPVILAMINQIRGIGNAVIGVVKVVHGLVTGDWAEAWAGLKQVAIDGVVGIIKATASVPILIAKALGREAFAGLEKVGGFIKDAVLKGLHGLVDGVSKAIIAAINKAIELLNKAIKAFNKIPIAPNIPTVPTLAPERRATPNRAPDEGTRGLTIIVNGDTDPENTARRVVEKINRQSRRDTSIPGGRTPGFRPF